MIYINDLFAILPNVILYIVTGYIFPKTFRFVALKEHSNNIKHILLESIVIGYVYCQVFFLLPFRFSHYVNILCAVGSSIIVSYSLGILCTSKYIDKILAALKIKDSLNTYFWDDLLDPEYAMIAIVEYEDKIYEGFLHTYESYSNSPHITLCLYEVTTPQGTVLEDETKNIKRIIILDTTTAKNVVIKYYKQSSKCDRIKGFLG